MSPFLETGALAGKIVCPGKKCGAKLGNFDWAGNRKFNLLLPSLIVQSSLTCASCISSECSCGAWVCPGFALNVSRVDEIKI
jgi:dual specificity phosphatase 12